MNASSLVFLPVHIIIRPGVTRLARLAVRNILGALFASRPIVLDKSFAAGDFLIIDEHMGAVETLASKTT